jgi:cell fate regulator YaaT (PSP1 superfamily)
MPDVVGIRFKRAGRVYYFSPGDFDLQVDEWVVVETARGREAGLVTFSPKEVLESDLSEPLKPVLRKAEPEDLQQMEYYRGREEDALAKCTAKVREHNLPMKLVRAEYNFDGSRLTFFFTAEGRVDFRDLVRDLASIFKTRIELRQIGIRDAAKLLDGLGRCGRVLCCASFLQEFNTVSIKMAKDQNLPLNPMKISGCCGRLLCCLGYENEQYCAAMQTLPALGQEVTIAAGKGAVIAQNVIKETVTVELESKATVEVPVSEVLASGERPSKSAIRRRRAK